MRESGDSLSEITARLRPACTRGRRVCGDDDRSASVECNRKEEDEEEKKKQRKERGREEERAKFERERKKETAKGREDKARAEDGDGAFLFIAFYSFRVAWDAARICHGGRHYYGKRTHDAPFIISKFIVLSRPINSSSLEIGTARKSSCA